MIPHKIYEIGGMLGLQDRDIRDLVANTSISDEPDKLEASLSPTDTYKDDGIWYGTISIKDFKGERGRVYPNKIYEIGKKLGMNKKDVGIVLTSEPNRIKVVEYTTSPVESYKGMPGRYGTLSIKDMR